MHIRRISFTALSLAALMVVAASCSTSKSPTEPTLDTLAPTVDSTNPANGGTSVATITASFSEAMNAATITSTTFSMKGRFGAPVAGTVTYDAATETARFVPTGALAPGIIYTATVSVGATDVAGNAMVNAYVWSFKTATALVEPPSGRRTN